MNVVLPLRPHAGFVEINPHPPAVFVVLLLQALAPDLLHQDFTCIPGGLRLIGSDIDIITDPDAGGLLVDRNPIMRHAERTGRSLLVVALCSPGIGLSCEGAVVPALGAAPISFANYRPWVDLVGPGLWLVPRRLEQPGAVHIQESKTQWHQRTPAQDMLHAMAGFDAADDRVNLARRALEVQL